VTYIYIYIPYLPVVEEAPRVPGIVDWDQPGGCTKNPLLGHLKTLSYAMTRNG